MTREERHRAIFAAAREFLRLVAVYVRQSLEQRPSVESIIASSETERQMGAAFVGLISMCGAEQFQACDAMDKENTAKREAERN